MDNVVVITMPHSHLFINHTLTHTHIHTGALLFVSTHTGKTVVSLAQLFIAKMSACPPSHRLVILTEMLHSYCVVENITQKPIKHITDLIQTTNGEC